MRFFRAMTVVLWGVRTSSSKSGSAAILNRTVMCRGGGAGGKEGEVGRDRGEAAVLGTGRSRFRSVGDDEADRLLPPLRFKAMPPLLILLTRTIECDSSEVV